MRELERSTRRLNQSRDVVDPGQAVEILGVAPNARARRLFGNVCGVVPGPAADSAEERGVHAARGGTEEQHVSARICTHLLCERLVARRRSVSAPIDRTRECELI